MKKILLTILLCFWAIVAFAAFISMLTDNFDDNSIDLGKWTIVSNNTGEMNETGEQLTFTTQTDGANDPEISSKTTYDITGSQITVKIIDAGNQALTSLSFFPLGIWDSTYNSQVEWRIDGGIIDGVGDGSATTATYVADTYRYLKIREASGKIYLDYSADGINWTNFSSVANPFTMTSVWVNMRCRVTAETSTTTAKVDDFNILPSGTTPSFSHAFNNGFGEGIDQGFN